MLDAVRVDIELDTRRAGDLTGISRETARIALWRLAGDGWLHPPRRPPASTAPAGRCPPRPATTATNPTPSYPHHP